MMVNAIGKPLEYVGISFLKLRMLSSCNHVHFCKNKLLVTLSCGKMENCVNVYGGGMKWGLCGFDCHLL